MKYGVEQMKKFIEQQIGVLEQFEALIAFDKEQEQLQGIPAEKTLVLKGFIETQKRSLNVVSLLIEKHEGALKAIEETEKSKAKAERDKREAEKKADMAKKAKEKAVEEAQIGGNLFSDETSETCVVDDGYGFEEGDEE